MAKIYDSIYTYFDIDEDIVEGNRKLVVDGAFLDSDGAETGSLTSAFTSSTQAALSSSNYYLHVYQAETSSAAAEVQFDIAFGTSSAYSGGTTYWTTYDPAYATYNQYVSTLLPENTSSFALPSGSTNNITIINFKRERTKEGINPGTWCLCLSGSSGITLVDNSKDTSPTLPTTNFGIGTSYYVYSGSFTNNVATASAYQYGIVYNDMGIIVLDNNALYTSASIDAGGLGSPHYSQSNHEVFRAISASISEATYSVIRNQEEVSSTHYFVRAKNKRYNFSNNPTWQTGSYGVLKYSEMYNDPKTYITSVGLYDDSNNLLAIAKLNRPVLKSFEREVLIKVKIDY